MNSGSVSLKISESELRRDWQARSRDYLMEHAARGDSRAAEILRGLLLSEYPVGANARGRVAVNVCTAMRPAMLLHCLKSISAQIVSATTEVHVVVVDNEPQASSQQLVEDFAARCPFPIHYVHEPRRGIPRARNAGLEKCRQLGADWIAVTDDDCWVNPLWIASLMAAAARHEADVVYGRREFLLPAPLPFWAAALDESRPTDGQRLPFAATHNVLFKAWLICSAKAGLSFDERLVHGEDTDFFYRAARCGAHIAYSHDPVVLETVSPQRATLRYQVRRAYYYGASRSYFHRRYSGLPRAAEKLAGRWMFQATVGLVRLGVALLVWPFSKPTFKQLVLKGTARLAGAAGATAGLFGAYGNPYRTIDGY